MADRFAVTYRILTDDPADARARAEAIALEQTVEVPRDVVPPGSLSEALIGRIEEIGPDDGAHRAVISYSPDSTGEELPQLLNVVFGNSSIQRGLKVTARNVSSGRSARVLFFGPEETSCQRWPSVPKVDASHRTPLSLMRWSAPRFAGQSGYGLSAAMNSRGERGWSAE